VHINQSQNSITIIHHRTFVRVGNVQYPGAACGSNHGSLPGTVTVGYPGFHGLGGTIPGGQFWPQDETYRGKWTIRGPITQPPMSTTFLFLRRRRRLRFVFSVVRSCSEEVELVWDNGEGVRVWELLCGLASRSESVSPSSGLDSDSPCVVSGHPS